MKTRSGQHYFDAGNHAEDGHRLNSAIKSRSRSLSSGVTRKARKPTSRVTKMSTTQSRKASSKAFIKKKKEPFQLLELPAEIRLVVYDHVVGEKYTHEVVLHPSLTEEGSSKTWMMTRPRNQGPDIYNLSLTNKQIHQETIKHVYKAINVKLDFPFAANMANILHEYLIAGIRPELIKKIDASLPIEPGMHVSFQKLLDFWGMLKGKIIRSLTLMVPGDTDGFFSEVIQKETTRAGRRAQRARRDEIILRSIEHNLAPIWKDSIFGQGGKWLVDGDITDHDEKLLALLP
ncbi:Hypothetical protein D9617_27g045450 [Elsinoe fawcettii]|nr:Hypothetical protein D9617_27g045450 [Elsinoe fawcettii]